MISIASKKNQEVLWVVEPGKPMPGYLHEMRHVVSTDREVTLEIDGWNSPRLEVVPKPFSADRFRYFYLVLRLPSPAQIQVCFQNSEHQTFDNDYMWLSRPPVFHEGLVAYRFDLKHVKGYSGTIRGLQIHFEGIQAGKRIGFVGVAVSDSKRRSLSRAKSTKKYAVKSQDAIGSYRGERIVACGRTFVSISEKVPTPGLFTYVRQHGDQQADEFDNQTQLALTKFIASLSINGKYIPVSRATEVEIIAEAGVLKANYRLADARIHVEVMPLRDICDSMREEGAALFTIETTPRFHVKVDCGEIRHLSVWDRQNWLESTKIDGKGNHVESNEYLLLQSSPAKPTIRGREVSEQAYFIGLKSSGNAKQIVVSRNGDRFARFEFEDGKGSIVASFSPDACRAMEIAQVNHASARRSSLAFLHKLLKSFRIATPDENIDRAFRSALLTMEYTWVAPFGCLESLHHWLAIWQQYPSAYFDWAGLGQRTKENIRAHLLKQYPSGNVPYLNFFGERHLDFGGNNQTFMWQVKHYLEMTGDRVFAKEILPQMRKLNRAWWEFEDPDGDGLSGFGVQILTQEDYVSSPHNATSPTVAAVEMLRTLALVERLAGNDEECRKFKIQSEKIVRKWKERLWLNELGRPAYFADELGRVRPEGQYHTLVLPIVHGFLDQLDSYSCARHLLDRLTGPQGEMFYSNNFPNHIGGSRSAPFAPTWGPQAGAYMQPWATWALNRVGLYNDAIRPLNVAAHWATMFPHKEAWPESSTELTPAYFSNTAANFVQGVIEALFGLQMNRPQRLLHIQPTFPDNWPRASFISPEVKVEYRRHENRFTYSIHSAHSLKRSFKFFLPVCEIRFIRINGEKSAFKTEPGVNGIWLVVSTTTQRDTVLEVKYRPIRWRISHDKSIAEGDKLKVVVKECEIAGLHDKQKIIERCEIFGDCAELLIRSQLLEKWNRFGRLGELNFSRRTVFLCCQAAGIRFWVSVNIAILPRFEIAPEEDLVETSNGYALKLIVRNNTNDLLTGGTFADFSGTPENLPLNVLPRSEKTIELPLSDDKLGKLTPGSNPLRFSLPQGHDKKIEYPVIEIFKKKEALKREVERSTVDIPLPEEFQYEDTSWMEFAAFPVFWQGPYSSCPPPLEAIEGMEEIYSEQMPGITFKVSNQRRLAVASWRLGHNAISLQPETTLSKIYLLIVPFVENHDIFTECLRVGVTCRNPFNIPEVSPWDEPVQWTKQRYPLVHFEYRFHTPGDLDSWMPEKWVGPFATARGTRVNRHGLLQQLSREEGDWPDGKSYSNPYGMFQFLEPPPRDRWPEGGYRTFPQFQYWARCPLIQTDSANFNVVEITLPKPREVTRIELECPVQDGAIGLVSAMGIKS